MKLALVAVQSATTLAVTTPLVLTMVETVTPFDGFALATVTVTPPAPLSVSSTEAISEDEPDYQPAVQSWRP